MKRVGFLLKVKQDKIEEYKQHHEAVWPEMLAALRRHGWHMRCPGGSDVVPDHRRRPHEAHGVSGLRGISSLGHVGTLQSC